MAKDGETVPGHFERKGSAEEEAKLSEEQKFRNMLERLDTYGLISYAKKEYDKRFHPKTGKEKLIEKIIALQEEKMAEEKERSESEHIE
jgi:hypothetical protein